MKLAVDPGIRQTGAAIFSNAGLVIAKTIKNPITKGHRAREALHMALAVAKFAEPYPIDEFVFELMQIRTNSPNPQGSLVPLVAVAHCLSGILAGAVPTDYLPHDWKGSYDGIECTRRVRERLSPDEFAVIALPSSACDECRKHFGSYCLRGRSGCGADHVYDAVGIGLKHAGRFERKRIFAR